MALANDPAVPATKLQLPKSSNFPNEIIYHIIHFLDPLELMRLQTISKQFHTLVNSPMVWQTIYINARYARPPGPFPWQSTRFLQRTLVRSSQLERKWPFQPLKVKESSRRQIRRNLAFSDHRWVSRRWLLIRNGMSIVSHDIDSESRQTLWDNGPISSWHTCSIMSAKGHMIYLVLRVAHRDQHDALKLLEFRADGDSGHLAGVVFDVPPMPLERQPYVECTSVPGSPFVHVDFIYPRRLDRALVFDTRSEIFYKFPQFKSELDEVQPFLASWSPRFVEILLPITHIIVMSEYARVGDGAHLMQAFIIPDCPIPDNTGVCELRLSHETGEGHPGSLCSLIRNSVVNSVDGSTTFRTTHVEFSLLRLEFHCTEFSLPRSRPDAILPMSFHTHKVLRAKGAGWEGYQHGLAEEEGIVRWHYVVHESLQKGHVLHKYTIDATGERCVAGHGCETSGSDVDTILSSYWVDYIRGRICYAGKRRGGEDDRRGNFELFVAELE